MRLDATGKVSLDHIYTQPDPRAYFSTLCALDYCIPQLAKPYFLELIQEYQESRQVSAPTVLDIGCSYGINTALLKCDATMDELFDRYCSRAAGTGTRGALLARDQELVRSRNHLGATRFVGLDSSRPALSYAFAAGFIEEAVHADLEKHEPTERQLEQLAGVDLVISTGCIGYVTHRTISRVVIANGERKPWMAHFVLRMFPFEPVAESLAGLGYETVHLEGVFKQRRFASAEEQTRVLDTLSDVGVDPGGLEAEGWLYAQLFVSRPRDAKGNMAADLANDRQSSRFRKSSIPRTNKLNSSQEWSTRTFGNEDRLPRVPLPTLEESCERFVEWSAPLLTAAELEATKSAVTSFLRPDGPGRKLHAALEQYNASPGVRSWLDTFWPSRYLGRRNRIALNANFYFLFKDSDQGQVERAAGLIAAAVNYKRQLDEELVAPVIQRGQAQTMDQNKFLFSTTRIPGLVQDTVRAPYTEEWPGPSQARHILVFFRGNMFRMDVMGPDGRPHTLDDLMAGLRTIMKAGAMRAPAEASVGHFTTMARAEWAASRQALLACHPSNVDALDQVETALFCICLEDFAPKDASAAADQLLHGDSSNRWFDKAVSLIVFDDGSAGINCEHCYLDGATILTFIDALLGTPAEEHSLQSGAESQGLPAVEAIEFVLDADLQAGARAAATAFSAYVADTATSTVAFDNFGANQAKQLRISPDGFAQMAYQIAHKRARGFVGSTYESIATRQYQNGRTEAMRVVTPEVLRFVDAMEDPTADAATRRAALRAAANKHVQRAKECQAGQAPEQHLWELQLIQQRSGETLGVTEPLALYESPGWVKMRTECLSTSSMSSTKTNYAGFGSTMGGCIGVGYVLLAESIHIYLCSPLSMADEMSEFGTKLRETMRELEDLLSSENPEG